MVSAELGTSRDNLAVRFERQGDRHAHVLIAAQTMIGQSIEGRNDESWPSSPPLQQLSIEDFGTGPVALLVGMAGRSHWSMSVETGEDGSVFDVACRVKGAPEQLGSTYRLDGFRLESPEAICLRSIALTNERGELSISWDDDETLEKCQLRWDAENHRLQIAAVDFSDDAETLRWRYRIRWTSQNSS